MNIRILKASVINGRLRVIIDHMPKSDEFRYRHDLRRKLWWGQADGMVRFFFWESPTNNGGFGGRTFRITTEDGEQIELFGPWSSRCGVMNKAGCPASMDVDWSLDGESWTAGHILVSLVAETGMVELTKVIDRRGEPTWTASER